MITYELLEAIWEICPHIEVRIQHIYPPALATIVLELAVAGKRYAYVHDVSPIQRSLFDIRSDIDSLLEGTRLISERAKRKANDHA